MGDPGHGPNRDGDEIPEITVSSDRVTVGNESFDFDHAVEDYVGLADRMVLLFDVWRGHDRHSTQPVLPEKSRNVSCFDYDGDRLWRIDDPPHGFPAEEYERADADGTEYWEGKYYKYLLEFGGDTYVRHTNRYRYEVDPASGELGGGVSDNVLTVGGRDRSFRAPVRKVLEIDGKTVVLLAYWSSDRLPYDPDGDLDDDGQVYCFDEDGDLLWRTSGSYVDAIERPDGLWLIQHYQSGSKYNVDVETGRVERSLGLREPF